MQRFMAGAGISGSKSKRTGFTGNELCCGLQDPDFIQYAFWPFLVKSVSCLFLIQHSLHISSISCFSSSLSHFHLLRISFSRSELPVASISPQETEADYESDFELDKVNQTI